MFKRNSSGRDAPFALVLRKEFKVGVPFVTDDLSTRETANWDDLLMQMRKTLEESRRVRDYMRTML